MPRRKRIGHNRTPATSKGSAAMSPASSSVVTANRVMTLQLAQIRAAAEPNNAPCRQRESLRRHVRTVASPARRCRQRPRRPRR
jgi:hypothetical protein